jgi:hypothetical protein
MGTSGAELAAKAVSSSVPSSFTLRLACGRALLQAAVALFETIQQLVEFLRTHPFQFLFKLAAILPVVWLDSTLRFAPILAHKLANLRSHFFLAMTHIS